MKNPDTYAVELTAEQWDTVVRSLEYVVARAYEPSKPNDMQPIDIFARSIVRSRVRVCIAEIRSNVPEEARDAK